MKKKPQRTCIACNIKKDKSELIRIVINEQGNIIVDKTGKLCGRGAYICDNIKCLEKLQKTKKLERIFNIKTDENIYNNIRGVIIDKIN